MIVTAWTNGRRAFGVKVSMSDRERFFSRQWSTVTLELEGSATEVEVNVGKKSFWNPRCGELIHREIGQWLRANGLAPWPYGKPPKLVLEPVKGARFRLRKPSS
ncbi:MAG TPA: hypothetical protein ENI39_03575 [Anaerolineae bacterium]|nr:hypothetical protein [Anaerolineae bacterium]